MTKADFTSTQFEILCVVTEGGNTDFADVMKTAGYKIKVDDRRFWPDIEDNTPDAIYLKENYGQTEIKAVISQLFIPVVAAFCHDREIPYISWIYDSPQQSLYLPEALYKTNFFFVFDKMLCSRMEQAGIPNVSHKPLAVNIGRSNGVVRDISALERRMLSHDISFVGNLYNVDAYLEAFDALEGDSADYIRSYYRENLCHWESVRPWPKMPSDICEAADQGNSHGFMPSDIFYGTAVMSRKLAQLERMVVLNHLAEGHNVYLYTGNDTSKLTNVKCHPPINYYVEAPKVFNCSKINLNITLPSIETGVPQRVFDIMGAGGFVLTNHQKEMEELFEIDREIVTFKNIEELTEKVEYYLKNEKERKAIAERGYRKVCEKFNMKSVMKEIYESIGTN